MTIPVVPQLDIEGATTLLFDSLVAVLDEMGFEMPCLAGTMPGGLVAFDGEQLTVNFMNITRGIPGGVDSQWEQPQTLHQYFEFEVNLLRAVPSIQNTGGRNSLPSVASQVTAFQQLAADASFLWAAIVAIHASFTIVPPGIPFMYGPLTSIGPEGGLAGSRLPVYWQALH